MVANIFNSLIPYMGLITEKMHVHFLSGFVPLALVSFVMSFFLPETINKKVEN